MKKLLTILLGCSFIHMTYTASDHSYKQLIFDCVSHGQMIKMFERVNKLKFVDLRDTILTFANEKLLPGI